MNYKMNEHGGDMVLKHIKEFFMGHKFEPSDYELYKEIKTKWFQLDLDQTGSITMRDFKTFCDKNAKGQFAKRNDPDAVKLAFSLVDKDHDGKITFEEFCKYNGLPVTKDLLAKIESLEAVDPHPVRTPERRSDGHARAHAK